MYFFRRASVTLFLFFLAIGAWVSPVPAAGQMLVHTIDASTTRGNNWYVILFSYATQYWYSPIWVGSGSKYPAVTFPGAYNDGFWEAIYFFTLPKNALSPVLNVSSGVAVSDRAVYELNGNFIAATGWPAPGTGNMEFTDGGPNNSFLFPQGEGGNWNIKVNTGFIPGMNSITIIVNNTQYGIFGAPCPLSCGGAASVGLLANITYQTENGLSHSGVVADANGALYGVTGKGGVAANGCCGTVFMLTPPATGQTAWTKTTLYAFKGGADGKDPQPGLLLGSDGSLYGVAHSGGVQSQYGVVYKLTPPAAPQTPWTESVIYSFDGGADGYAPDGGLIAGNDGTLYGVTERGGTGACKDPSGSGLVGCGTVYSLAAPTGGASIWTKTKLHDFQGSDGQEPTSGLVTDIGGNLYGVTTYGGTGPCTYLNGAKSLGCGVVFEVSPPAAGQTAWTETTLYKFFKPSSGYHPRTALIRDDAGDLYGTTDTLTGQGGGIVFELRPPYGTKSIWTLYARGQLPHYGTAFAAVPAIGDLAIDANGVLYGTTSTGGDLTACGGLGCGTAFSLAPPSKGQSSLAPWTLTTLYDFAGPTADGAAPHWGVALSTSGSVMGVTEAGGTGVCSTGCGTVFTLTPPAAGATAWSETVPYSFNGGADGFAP